MIWNDHSKLNGCHAFLSASKYHWLRYDDARLVDYWRAQRAATLGTELHELAARCIKHGVKLSAARKTLNMFVNDAVGFKMTPEQVLYYSPLCFGTADAISFRDRRLRIHDLKTGTTSSSLDQLRIYAALFCLEYHEDPDKVEIELRIYQNNMIEAYVPEPGEIAAVMATVEHANQVLASAELT